MDRKEPETALDCNMMVLLCLIINISGCESTFRNEIEQKREKTYSLI